MKKKSAFTFIEVMIAIAVFSIGVLSVLRLVTQNLVTLDATQARTMATFLAKEWMELVYNMRDSNIDKWLPRDCLLKTQFEVNVVGSIDLNVCAWNFASWTEDHQILQISFDPKKYTYANPVDIQENFVDLWSGNRLYYTTWNVWDIDIFRYSSLATPESTPTAFARYIVFTGVREGETILPRDKLLKVESHVLYVKWSKTWEVILESFVWNY